MDALLKEFLSYPFSDSVIRDINIISLSDGSDIQLKLFLCEVKDDATYFRECNVLFQDCIMFDSHMNLKGKSRVSDSIGNVSCSPFRDSELFGIATKELNTVRIGYDMSQYDDYIHFNIRFVIPGGYMNIVARDFKLTKTENLLSWKQL